MTISSTKNVSAEVDELRKRFFDKLNREGAPAPDGFHPDDLERIRTKAKFVNNFLEQHDMNVSGALTMLWETCQWRKSFGTNDITEKNVNMQYINDAIYYPHNHDIDGKTLFIHPSHLHSKNARDSDELLRVFIYWLERMWRQSNYDKYTFFFDLTGCGLGNVDLGYTRNVINVLKNYYPNSINYLLVFELPWVLNAAFKVIKSVLPPKIVASMRFVSAKNLSDYVPRECQLTRWGGPDSYVFKFVPENNGAVQLLDTPPKTPLPAEAHVDTKKVHFVSNLPDGNMESTLSNGGSITFSDKCTEGVMLRLSPVEAIHFLKSGNDLVGTVEITNIIQTAVTYKIKTTSPDKFRVRPSSGVLAPGASTSINVVLLQGPNTNNMATLVKDKFLVMCMELAADSSTSTHDITELWKNTPSSSALVEQHRLKCWPANAAYTTELGRNGTNTPLNGHFEFSGQSPARHLEATVAQLLDSTTRLESQVKFTQTLQWITMLLFLFLAIAIVYILKIEIKHMSVDYCLKRH